MKKTRRISPSMRHLHGVVRQEFSKLELVEAVFIDVGRNGTRIWAITKGVRNPAVVRALAAKENKIRQMRPASNLKLNFNAVPLGKEPKAPLLRFFRRSGAICAYLRKPERRAA